MSQSIVSEVTFFLHSFLMGIVITFVYDGFIILRRLIRHSDLLISLEDMIFWIACAIGVFYMLYEENKGILRWFAVLGASLGMILYKKTVSPLLVRAASSLIRKITRILARILGFLLRPFRFAVRKTVHFSAFSLRKGKKVGKRAKIKLTAKLKLLKITLCGH